jgi:hypothetical protein
MRRAAPPAALLAVSLLAVFAPASFAHKGITSKFTYNADVHPIFLSRCSRCHVEGGVGPMSLLKYEEAFPWAEALRVELLAAASADPHDFVRAAHRQISARELDIVLEWATGGTPEGDKEKTPAATTVRIDWADGAPHLIASMSSPYQMSATTAEAMYEAAMAIDMAGPITVSRIDMLPGNPAIVRSAVLSLRRSDGTTTLLGTWVPRQVPAPIALKPHVRMEPGSHISARIHYRKTWKNEGETMTDSSRVGLYLAD